MPSQVTRYFLRMEEGSGVVGVWGSGVGFKRLLLLFPQIQQDDLSAAWKKFWRLEA